MFIAADMLMLLLGLKDLWLVLTEGNHVLALRFTTFFQKSAGKIVFSQMCTIYST